MNAPLSKLDRAEAMRVFALERMNACKPHSEERAKWRGLLASATVLSLRRSVDADRELEAALSEALADPAFFRDGGMVM